MANMQTDQDSDAGAGRRTSATIISKKSPLGYTAEMAVEEAGRCLQCKNPQCAAGAARST